MEKDSARFRFIISHLCENFGEIHVSTGNTWMTTCNDWEVSQGNLKAQIGWFAENLIVPEQKEAYVKDFELDNLLKSLRQNDGFYAPTYEADYPDGRRYLLIINALLDNLENPEEEYIFSYVQDITQLKAQETKNKHLACSMKKVFRSSDVLCRWGGDEFVVFMPDVSSMAVVEELIENLQKEMCSHRRNHLPLPITLSIGGIIFKRANSLASLYEEADKYLYQVKSSGRDDYYIAVID